MQSWEGSLTKLKDRLEAINIKIEYKLNTPWIYLYSVNDKYVKERFYAKHGFTVLIIPARLGVVPKFIDRKRLFKKIREMVEE